MHLGAEVHGTFIRLARHIDVVRAVCASVAARLFAETTDGNTFDVPRNTLQKPLEDRKHSLQAIQHVGDFYCYHDSSLAESVLDTQPTEFFALLRDWRAWFRKPPEAMPHMSLRVPRWQV